MLNLDRSTWRRVKFGDVITSVTSRVDDPSTAGVERYVGLEHLDPGSMTVNRWGSPEDVAATKLLFEPGDVIFGRRRAYQKKVARADFKGICSAHAMVLRAKPEHIDPDFLPVFLSSDEFLDRAVSISVGSLSPTVNWKSLAVQEFDLPPLDQQRRIADLLWAVERHARALRSSSERQDAAASAAYDARIRHYVTEFGTVSLEDLSMVRSGITLGPKRKDLPPSPYLRVANVQRARVDLTEVKEVGASDNERENRTLEEGDVLVVEGHANASDVGRAALWLGDAILFQNHIFAVRSGDGTSGEFVAGVLNSAYGRAYFKKSAKSTSGLHTINSRVVRSFPMPNVPPTRQSALVGDLRLHSRAQEDVRMETQLLAQMKGRIFASIFGGSR